MNVHERTVDRVRFKHCDPGRTALRRQNIEPLQRQQESGNHLQLAADSESEGFCQPDDG